MSHESWMKGYQLCLLALRQEYISGRNFKICYVVPSLNDDESMRHNQDKSLGTSMLLHKNYKEKMTGEETKCLLPLTFSSLLN